MQAGLSRMPNYPYSQMSSYPRIERNRGWRHYSHHNDPGLLVLEPTQKHLGTVIFLHGLGDTAFGWKSVVDYFKSKTPHLRYILPTAPPRPVTINDGVRMPAWYDIKSLNSRSEVDVEGLKETKARVSRLIENEIRNGIPSNRILLGGFSQGGASALYVAYSYDKPLGGVMALSAYLPNISTFERDLKDANRQTELFMCHGDLDGIVVPDWGKKSFDTILKAGLRGRFKMYPGMEHSCNQEEIDDCLAFIQERLGRLSKL